MKRPFLPEKTTLSSTEEKHFKAELDTRLLHWLWIPLVLLLLFELYNMIYTLFYTDFTLRTPASKVYFTLYLLLFVLLLLFGARLYLPRRKFIPGDVQKIHWILCEILLLWSLCIAVYDQRVSDDVSVYTLSLLAIAVMAYFPPRVAFPLFTVNHLLLLLFLPLFQTGAYGDNYGVYVNSTVLTVFALFICCYRYSTAKRDFKKNLIIEEKSQELDYLAKHDQLTGLFNRRYLEEYLHKLYQQKVTVQVYMIDIDNFKAYNDRYGHVMGDDCLQKVASAIQVTFLGGYLFRFGGEEFLGVLTLPLNPQSIGEKILRNVTDLNIPSYTGDQPVTVSIGTASGLVSSEADWENLLKKADHALYQAKSGGRNRVCS